jgi:hypothetical protein
MKNMFVHCIYRQMGTVCFHPVEHFQIIALTENGYCWGTLLANAESVESFTPPR